MLKIVKEAKKVPDSLSPLLTVAVTALEVAKAFFSAASNPFAALVVTLVNQIQTLVNDLFATGVYVLVVQPFDLASRLGYKSSEDSSLSYKVLKSYSPENEILSDEAGFPILTPQKAIQKAIDSFDDEGDVARPRFSESASVTGLGLMVTAPSLDLFQELLTSLNQVFKIPEFEFILHRIELTKSVYDGSEKPDWQSLKLNSISTMRSIQDGFNDLLETVKGYLEPKNSAVEDLISLVQEKIEDLQAKIDNISSILESISNALAASGIYVLNIPKKTGGTAYLQEALEDPEFSKLKDNTFTALVLFVGGTGDTNQVNDILAKSKEVYGRSLALEKTEGLMESTADERSAFLASAPQTTLTAPDSGAIIETLKGLIL